MEDNFQDVYFECEWNSNEYDKPWHDIDFLTKIYTSDKAPTQQEIGDELGCSATTIGRYLPDDAQRGGLGLPYEDIAMFSGGYDSLVSTHYSMEVLDCDCVLHIDTQTGIDRNKEFVKDVCDWFGWTLEIVTPNTTLTEFGKEYGLPKAAAHSWIYRYLKEHPLAAFVTEIEADKPTFYTGVRKEESSRRMENVSTETQEHWNGRWEWEAPIAEFTEQDVYNYLKDKGLPRSQVVETIGRSGECFCGAYADRFSELLTLKEHYPEHYEWIMDVEKEVQDEIGTDEDHCYWGSAGISSDELQEVMEAEDKEPNMTMCADCEGGGHRTIGHDQDPTYETVYLAGPRCDSDDPYRFHQLAESYDETVTWVNPFTLHDYDTEDEACENAEEVYGTDIDTVRNSDVVLLRRVSEYNLVGGSIEAAIAAEKYGIPVVVFNDADDDVPLMLNALAEDVCENRKEAIQKACVWGRRKVTNLDDEKIFVR